MRVKSSPDRVWNGAWIIAVSSSWVETRLRRLWERSSFRIISEKFRPTASKILYNDSILFRRIDGNELNNNVNDFFFLER